MNSPLLAPLYYSGALGVARVWSPIHSNPSAWTLLWLFLTVNSSPQSTHPSQLVASSVEKWCCGATSISDGFFSHWKWLQSPQNAPFDLQPRWRECSSCKLRARVGGWSKKISMDCNWDATQRWHSLSWILSRLSPPTSTQPPSNVTRNVSD